jgi:microsomal dipeptidase-like Zn-dependent dipeptidase
MNAADPREIARSAYKVYFAGLTFDEHRTLAKHMEELVATAGWEAIVDVIGGDFTAFAETVVLTGDFDERGAGIATGFDRVLSFPQLVMDTFNERDRMEAVLASTQEA